MYIGLLPGLLFLVLITAGRLAGAFQLLEWRTLDAFLRSHPSETIDERILLVGIDERSIRAAGTYPISDQQLAHLLQTLQAHQPRVIGLDLFRDLPVEPGHQEMAAAMRDMDNLIGIERVLPPQVAPPPNLPSNQVGFVDLLPDGDGRQRRVLLGTQTDQGFRFSLGLLLAQTYLAAEGIPLSNGIRDRSTMRFGEAELPRVKAKFGGYVGTNAGGGDVQILLNFRKGANTFRFVSFQDALADNFNPEWVRDRIVLIGSTAPSIQDHFNVAATSTISQEDSLVYGVEIQAHAVSQIIDAALNQRPLIKSWPDWAEYLWILGWGILGIGFARYLRSPLQSLFWVSISLVGVTGISYLALLVGWWLPLVPAVASLLLNSAGLAAFYQYDRVIQTQIKAQQQVVTLLEQAKSDLEIKVAERTAELQKSNAELQQSNVELDQAREVAETASRAKSSFLAQISHELRTPLNSILGFGQLMAQDQTLSQINQNRVRLINQTGEHFLGLINDILTLSKLESNKQTLHEATFELKALIETIAALFQLRIEQKGLTFLIEVSPTIPQKLIGDAPKLRQVLINLLSNALKFTHTGTITLRVGERQLPQGLYLHFEVEDTGTGIAASELHKLFEPFVQTESGENTKTGTGLGLAISKQLIQLMGGDLKVLSQVGKGSIFTFTVQVQIAPAKASLDAQAASKLALSVSGEGLPLQQAAPNLERALVSIDASVTTPLSVKAITAELTTMPPDWLHDLYWAAFKLEGRQVMALLETLTASQETAAKYLVSLAEGYQYRKIAELIKPMLSGDRKHVE
ncbi:MAG: CHASE2 domain-containing protein [Leptolyngbya sp. SIO1E4]|nr:CHASE2 domain-containing protein [Leptolyngbya sp. SIO1E4]